MSFRVYLQKLARNLNSESSQWKFNDPDYSQFHYTLTARKLEILSEKDYLWKIDIQNNKVDDADLDIISIQLIDSCDEGSPNCYSKLYNLSNFGPMPFYIYQEGRLSRSLLVNHRYLFAVT
jgi:hypothetical protein